MWITSRQLKAKIRTYQGRTNVCLPKASTPAANLQHVQHSFKRPFRKVGICSQNILLFLWLPSSRCCTPSEVKRVELKAENQNLSVTRYTPTAFASPPTRPRAESWPHPRRNYAQKFGSRGSRFSFTDALNILHFLVHECPHRAACILRRSAGPIEQAGAAGRVVRLDHPTTGERGANSGHERRVRYGGDQAHGSGECKHARQLDWITSQAIGFHGKKFRTVLPVESW